MMSNEMLDTLKNIIRGYIFVWYNGYDWDSVLAESVIFVNYVNTTKYQRQNVWTFEVEGGAGMSISILKEVIYEKNKNDFKNFDAPIFLAIQTTIN